jgi:hypothetical protein
VDQAVSTVADTAAGAGAKPAEIPTITPVDSEKKSAVISGPLLIVLAIAAVLVLGIIIFFTVRNLRGSPNRAMAMAALDKPAAKGKKAAVDHSRELAKYAAGQSKQRSTPYTDHPVKETTVINTDGPLLLNLFVEDQNTAIGKRNVHSLKSGYGLSVGGGSSDFLVFLVPFPPRIGEIRRKAGQCTFIPHKPKYFPDLGSNEMRDCINKTIRVVSDKDYELRMRFELYEDPLIQLNKMLNSLNIPG